MIPDRTSGDGRKKVIFDGAYQIISTVGHGRSSIVYKARRLPEANKPIDGANLIVALKVLTGNSKDPEANVNRMKREALAMLSARHPNVVRLIDFVTTGDLCYLCMEYAERGDLGAELIRRGHPFSAQEAIKITKQIVSGLEAIHRAGIIHRDIKPDNLLLTFDGRIKIADFGIAFLPTERISLEDLHRGVGTFDYLAPECLEATDNSAATDLYSAAITLYQLITGELPFGGESIAQQIENKMSGNRTPLQHHLGQSHPELERFFDLALATDPANRFLTVADFLRSIEHVLRSYGPMHAAIKAEQIETAPAAGRSLLSAPIPAGNVLLEALDDEDIELNVDYPPAVPTVWSKFERPVGEFIDRLYERTFALAGKVQPHIEMFVEEHRKLLFALVPALILLTIIGVRAVGSVSAIASSDAGADRIFRHDRYSILQSIGQTLHLVSTPEAVHQLTNAAGVQHAGQLFNFFADQSNLPLAILSLDPRHVVFILGVSGWVPQVLDISAFDREEEIRLAANGIDLSLWVNKSPAISGGVISGHYKERGSGREGNWVITK